MSRDHPTTGFQADALDARIALAVRSAPVPSMPANFAQLVMQRLADEQESALVERNLMIGLWLVMGAAGLFFLWPAVGPILMALLKPIRAMPGLNLMPAMILAALVAIGMDRVLVRR